MAVIVRCTSLSNLDRKLRTMKAFLESYTHTNTKSLTKKAWSVKCTTSDYQKWLWIWDSSKETRWLKMKADFEGQVPKTDVCGSFASVLSLIGNNIHFPGIFGKMSREEILECLKNELDIDKLTLRCLNTLFTAHF